MDGQMYVSVYKQGKRQDVDAFNLLCEYGTYLID